MKNSPLFNTRLFLFFLFSTLLVAIVSTAYIFLVQQKYHFILEGSCDSEKQSCYYRDCNGEDAGCYDYDKESYTIYRVPAASFLKCENQDQCANLCSLGEIRCEEIVCDPNDEVVCSESEEQPEMIESIE